VKDIVTSASLCPLLGFIDNQDGDLSNVQGVFSEYTDNVVEYVLEDGA
jgi:hypothetical protein